MWPAVGDAHRAAHAEAALGEVEAVADGAADAVEGDPPDERVSTPPCRMKSSISRPTSLSAKAVTTAVRLPKQRRRPRATLYSPPPSQTRNLRAVRIASLAGIEAEHDLAERDDVERTFLCRPDGQAAHGSSPLPRRTASRAKRVTVAKSRAAISSSATIQLPPTAATDGSARYDAAFAALTPPVGIQRTPGNGPCSARRSATPPRHLGRKELEEVEAVIERRNHLGGRRDTGNDEHVQLPAALDDAGG